MAVLTDEECARAYAEGMREAIRAVRGEGEDLSDDQLVRLFALAFLRGVRQGRRTS